MLADFFRAAIFAAAHLLGGSLGVGILAVSFVLRIAMLPLTTRLARRAAEQQRILAGIRPEVVAIQERHAKDPAKQWEALQKLYARSGYRPFSAGALFGNLAQIPAAGGVYAALRTGIPATSFLWIGDLARTDLFLATVIAAFSALAGYLTTHLGGGTGRAPMIAASFAGVITMLFCWRATAGVALSWGASTVVSAAQSGYLAWERSRALRPTR